MPNETSFGQKLKALREEKGLTQEALAKRIEEAGGYLSRVHIARLETDKQQPSLATAQKIAAALDVDCTAFQDEPPAKKPRRKKGKE